jgi:hypothetical protein
MAKKKPPTEGQPFEPRAVRWDLLKRMYEDDPLLAELFARMDTYSADDYFRSAPTPYWGSAVSSAGPLATSIGSFSTGTTWTSPLPYPSFSTASTVSIHEPQVISVGVDGTYTIKYKHDET